MVLSSNVSSPLQTGYIRVCSLTNDLVS